MAEKQLEVATPDRLVDESREAGSGERTEQGKSEKIQSRTRLLNPRVNDDEAGSLRRALEEFLERPVVAANRFPRDAPQPETQLRRQHVTLVVGRVGKL